MAIIRTSSGGIFPAQIFRRKKTQTQPSFRVLGCYPENFRPKEFMRDSDAPHLDVHLCSRCRLIDFRAIFDLDYENLPKYGKPVFELLDFRKNMLQAACPLCRLFSKMIFQYDCTSRDVVDEFWFSRSGKRKHNQDECEDFHFRAYKNEIFDHSDISMDMPIGRCEVVISVVEGAVFGINHALSRHTFTSRSTLRQTNLQSTLEASTTIYEISLPLLESTAETASTLLHHCLRNHESCRHGHAFISSVRAWGSDCACLTSGSTKGEPNDFPSGARVIHCSSRRILPLIKGMKYLALSYVWGAQSHPFPESLRNATSTGTPPGTLPQTIEDAITLTLRLGFQYVWIDRYCIEQCHSSDKQHQISQMSIIYSTAVATICALGSDDKAGIVGISTPITYTSASVQGIQLISIVHKIRYHIRGSTWSTRGWTLQEVMVSPRCLLFTEEGVTLICRAGYLNERTALKNSHRRIETEFDRIGLLFVTENRPDSETPYRAETNPESTPFAVLRNEYQKRRLGYDEDGYHAFSAILTQCRTPSYWGLMNKGHPGGFIKNKVRREDWNKYSMEGVTIGFAHALTWYVKDPSLSKRRISNELPSWSWVSQTGRIEDTLVHGNPLFCPEIDVVSQDLKTCLDIGSCFWKSNCRSLISCESKYLIVKSMVVDWELSEEHQGKKEPEVAINPCKVGKWTLSGGQSSWFDKSLIYFDNKDNQNNAQQPQTGKAILLTMSGYKSHHELHWLAITLRDDGTYRRIGVIRTNFAHEDFGYYVYWHNGYEYKEIPDGTRFVPPAEYVKSIWLG